MTKGEIREFVKDNMSAGTFEHGGEQIPFVAVPNPEYGESLDIQTIPEVLRANAKKHE